MGPVVAGTRPGTAGSAPRWRFLVSPRWLAWHAFAIVAFWGMCWLGDWQLHRALAGNSLSWAYTFEWPLFAVMGAIFWAKTIRDELRLRSGAGTQDAGTETAERDLPGGAVAADGPPRGADHDAHGAGAPGDGERAAYLARLNQEVKGHGRWHGLR